MNSTFSIQSLQKKKKCVIYNYNLWSNEKMKEGFDRIPVFVTLSVRQHNIMNIIHYGNCTFVHEIQGVLIIRLLKLVLIWKSNQPRMVNCWYLWKKSLIAKFTLLMKPTAIYSDDQPCIWKKCIVLFKLFYIFVFWFCHKKYIVFTK